MSATRPDVRRARLLFRWRAYLHNARAADITSALGRHLKNQTTSLIGFRSPVAQAGVEDRPIYAPAYRTGACPSDVKLAPGARRRMRTVSWWCGPIILGTRGPGEVRRAATTPLFDAIRSDAQHKNAVAFRVQQQHRWAIELT